MVMGDVVRAVDVHISWDDWGRTAFGKPLLRRHFDLKTVYLDAASFGATPKAVAIARTMWEAVCALQLVVLSQGGSCRGGALEAVFATGLERAQSIA